MAESPSQQPGLIREARAEDLPRLLQLYQQLQPADPVLGEARAREAFDQILARPGMTLFVLARGHSIEATCYLNIIPNLTRSARPYAIIENVVTEAALRGQGLGKQIIQHALAAAWQAGCYKVMLQTGSKRESTHAFYRACGFSGNDKQAYVAWRPA